MSKIIHFEIGVVNPSRAIKFYSEVFGWKLIKHEKQDYWSISTEGERPEITGGIFRKPKLARKINVINAISVPSLDDFITYVVHNDGEVIMSNRTIPGVGRLAYCRDTEGNYFAIIEPSEGL